MPYYFGGTYYVSSQEFRFTKRVGSQESYFYEWIDSVVNLANVAKQKGGKMIIQTPTPEWKRELRKSCSAKDKQWFNSLSKTNCQIKSNFFIDEEKGVYKHLFKKLNQLSSSYKNIYIFDAFKIVCPKSICSFTRDGVDIYSDDDHLSYGWARDFLAPEISKFINKIKLQKSENPQSLYESKK